MFKALSILPFLVAPVAAAENLSRYADLIGQQNAPLAFTYAAPEDGWTDGTRAGTFATTDPYLNTALATGKANKQTGVDFSAVTGVLEIGTAPDTMTVLFGRTGFADNLEKALIGRGYETRSINGNVAFASGQDFAIDLMADRLDPFGGGAGKAQRLAKLEDQLILTRSWSTLEGALEQKSSTQPRNPWADALAVIAKEGRLEGAVGLLPTALFSPVQDPASQLLAQSPASDEVLGGGTTKAVVGFDVAVLAATRSDSDAKAVLALTFPTQDAARSAAALMVDNMAGSVVVAEASVVAENESFIALLTLDTDAQTAHEVYRDWMRQTFQRHLVPLGYPQ